MRLEGLGSGQLKLINILAPHSTDICLNICSNFLRMEAKGSLGGNLATGTEFASPCLSLAVQLLSQTGTLQSGKKKKSPTINGAV